MLVSNFFSAPEEEKFIIALESWMLFGLNWTYVMKSLKVAETGELSRTFIDSSMSSNPSVARKTLKKSAKADCLKNKLSRILAA